LKPDLGNSFLSGWNGIPPGMPTGDLLIWLRYRNKLASVYDHVYFNVRIGDPLFPTGDQPPEILDMAIAISRRRVDVVCEGPDHWLLIELKYNAGTESLGQILMYNALWRGDPPDGRGVRLSIISDRLNKDLIEACKYYNVDLLAV